MVGQQDRGGAEPYPDAVVVADDVIEDARGDLVPVAAVAP